MPWQEQSMLALRREFVAVAAAETVPFRHLCQRYGISAKTGYKWVRRAAAPADPTPAAAGTEADAPPPRDPLADRSRRPRTSPRRTGPDLVAAVLAIRDANPAWGGRKIHHRLLQLGHAAVPAPSTITDLLHRHDRITPVADAPRRWQRFAQAAPNGLWQLDFMGHTPLDQARGGRDRLHPLAVLDDCSRFALGLAACATEQGTVVEAVLTGLFRRYGLPAALLADNGPPWGTAGSGGISTVEAWLLRLGIDLWHGRAYHPQTQGKVERFHGTVAAEVLTYRPPTDLAAAQVAFDAFRHTYNHERPHEAIGYAVPASRYAPSPRPFPERLPEPVYGPDDTVRRVQRCGTVSVAGRPRFVGHGLAGQTVALRPTLVDGVVTVYFCHRRVVTLDLR